MDVQHQGRPLRNVLASKKKKRKMSVADAFEYLIQEEENKLLDMDQVTPHRPWSAPNKWASSSSTKSIRLPAANPVMARMFHAKAVQRDILPHHRKAPPSTLATA